MRNGWQFEMNDRQKITSLLEILVKYEEIPDRPTKHSGLNLMSTLCRTFSISKQYRANRQTIYQIEGEKCRKGERKQPREGKFNAIHVYFHS